MGFQSHLGTDAQRSAWILFLVSLIVFLEHVHNLYIAEKYFLSCALYVIGTFLLLWGCALFVKSSYPDQIVASCFYSNESIEPPAGSWCCRVHCGTRVLRGGQLQLLGSVLYALASAVWIQENYLYRQMDKHTRDSDDAWEYVDMVFGSFLLVSGCLYQLRGQYPQSVLKRGNSTNSSWFSTDLQVSGWFLEILSLLWLIRSSIAFDQSASSPEAHGEEPAPSVPLSDYDWAAFGDCWVSLLAAVGCYFSLTQSYREGTRMDAVLIQQATAPRPVLDEESLLPPLEGVLGVKAENAVVTRGSVAGSTPQRPSKVIPHPLAGIKDLGDAKTIIRRARKVANDESGWRPTNSINKDTKVWLHAEAHAVLFETSRFASVDPLVLAALIQSETFKSFQLRAPGSSVNVVGKLGASSGQSAMGAVVFFEKIPPNPPMPAHESTFASVLHESRRVGADQAGDEIAEVVEWSVDGAGAGARVVFTDAVPAASAANVVKVSPFRYWSVSASGTLRGCVWLEDIARWMPDFLLKAEMGKIPLLSDEIGHFLTSQSDKVASINKQLNMWIWQRVHNSVSPLAAAVLVRTSPAYRVLLSKYPGLRTRVPDQVSVPVGALAHPLDHFPLSLSSDADIDVPIAVKHGADFISNEFGSWHASDADSRQKPGRARVTVWRQELEGERVRPFRIQARIHGVDPMTLALLIHRNKLNELMESYSGFVPATAGTPTASLRSRMSITSSPERPDQSVLTSMIGEDHVTVSNNLVATFQNGQVRVYTERKRRTKFMPGSREREFTFASVMKDVTPLKAVVVHFGVTDTADLHKSDEVVKLRRFHAWALENDGGTDTKLTWTGLVPVGGRAEKLSAWLSSGSELKEKTKFIEKLANLFANDMRAKEAIAECHQYIAYSTIRSAMGKELRKLSVNHLSEQSQDFKALMTEIQPVIGGVMNFEQDLPHVVAMKRRQDAERRARASPAESDEESVVTVPLSPVESHRREDDDQDEVKTQYNGDLVENEDVIPNSR